jgi:3-methyladenine DNA glycosylase AlkD
MQYDEILTKLKDLSDPQAVEGMARFGIKPEHTFGVSVTNLRRMAKEIGTDHNLAQRLWASGIRDARVLASLSDDPALVTKEQMESWVKDFDSWDVCDGCCANLFRRTRFAYQKASQWSSNEQEFIKRAGFVLMADLAVHDKKAEDDKFEPLFSMVKREATDNRNYVRKAVNWSLRQIGKRNLNLNKMAIETAKEIREIDSKSAKWIAADALRELVSDKVQAKLRVKVGKG